MSGRLDELAGLLKSRDDWTTQALSRELGVSHRTLSRDLAHLREAGYPIEGDRGRGGGVRLQRHWSAGRLHLDYREALDLLLCLAVMEKAGSPLLLTHLRAIRNKVALSFAEASRKRILSLRKRIWVGAPASPKVLATAGACSPRVLEQVQQAFFEMRCLKIRYEDEKGNKTERTIEPQLLFHSAPIWYVLAWDARKADARSFRLDRIRWAEIQEQPFTSRREEAFVGPAAAFSAAI